MVSPGAIRGGEAQVEVSTDLSPLDRGLGIIRNRMQGLERSIASVGDRGFFSVINRVKGLGTAIKASVAVGALQAAASVLVKKFADAGSEVNDFSMRTGMSAQQISKLSYAAAQSGTDLATVESSFKRLQANIATGSPLITKLGLSLRELQDATPDEQFNRVAKRIAAIESPTLRAYTALQLFGKSGTALLPVFQDLGTLSQEAEKLGLVFTPEQAAKADAVGDAIGKAASAISGFAISVGSAISPDVLEFLDGFTSKLEAATGWVKQNEETVQLLAKAMVGLGIASVVGAGISALGFALRGTQHFLDLKPVTFFTGGLHLMRKEVDLLKPSIDKLNTSLGNIGVGEAIAKSRSAAGLSVGSDKPRRAIEEEMARRTAAGTAAAGAGAAAAGAAATKAKAPKGPKSRFKFGNALVDAPTFTDDNAASLVADVQKNNKLLESEASKRTKALGALSGKQGGRLNLRYGILTESAKVASSAIQPTATAVSAGGAVASTAGAVTAAAEAASSITKVTTAAKGLSIFARAAGWIKTAAGFVGFLVTKLNPWIAGLTTLIAVLSAVGAMDWIWSLFQGKKATETPEPPKPKPEPKKDTVNARTESMESALTSFLQAGATGKMVARIDDVALAQIKGALFGGQRVAPPVNNKVMNDPANRPKQLTPREQLRKMLDEQIARQGGKTTFRQRQALKTLETPEERDAKLQKNIDRSRKAQGLEPMTVEEYRTRSMWDRMGMQAKREAVARATLGPKADKASIKAEADGLRNDFSDPDFESHARMKAVNNQSLAKLFEKTTPLPPKEPRKPFFQRMAEAREQKRMEEANPELKKARIDMKRAEARARLADKVARGVIPSAPGANPDDAVDAASDKAKELADIKARFDKQREVASLKLEDEKYRSERYNKMDQLASQRQSVFANLGGSTGSFSSGVAGRMFGGGVSELGNMVDSLENIADNTGDMARDLAALRDSGGLE